MAKRKTKKNKAPRIFLLISILFLAAVLIAAAAIAVVTARPEIILNGESSVEVQVFSDFTAADAIAGIRIAWFYFDLDVVTEGTVDTQKLGTYTVTHSAGFMGRTTQVQQTVTVADTVAPQLQANVDGLTYEYEDLPATADEIDIECTATDNYDGDITGQIVKTLDTRVLQLSVSDSSGNTAILDIPIKILDSVAPTLELTGSSTIYLPYNSTFTDPGFTAQDNKDGDITHRVEVTGTVNSSRSGTYALTYTVTDTAGNTTTVTRKVIVFGANSGSDYEDVPPNGKTVYLTFDDGPGSHTEKLLGYLDQYGVKATFFVTNQFPRYQDLIKETYERGHAIGIHTTTHEWSIYSSTEAYYEDFNTMQDIVRKQTGTATSIFRFPGGTSNTVSRSYCKGIMTTLSQEMLAAGFVYFDWHVDSGDTRTTDTQEIISSTIEQISKRTNSIILLHDIKKHTVEAIPAIIEWCLANGYTFDVLDVNSPSCKFRPNN